MCDMIRCRVTVSLTTPTPESIFLPLKKQSGKVPCLMGTMSRKLDETPRATIMHAQLSTECTHEPYVTCR